MAEKRVNDPKKEVKRPTRGSSKATGESTQTPDATRRGLVKAGIITAPLVLTLKGRAAMAQDLTNNPNNPHDIRHSLTASECGSRGLTCQLNQDDEFKRG